ncbi:MAG: RNA polymerase sigma factor [Bacillota bacterium]|nr:RNA polymerase sigma factor [Bacillota bacterium]
MDSIEVAIEEVKKGNSEPFAIIINEFQQQLFFYCYHMLGNIHEAEEAVQETFFRAYRKIYTYQKTVSFSAWLYKIAYNHCVNIIRRKKLIRFLPFTDGVKYYKAGIDKEFAGNELNEELCDALESLSPEERHIIILRIVKEKSHEEISTMLNIKPSTVRKKYERAIKKLRVSVSVNKGGIINETI